MAITQCFIRTSSRELCNKLREVIDEANATHLTKCLGQYEREDCTVFLYDRNERFTWVLARLDIMETFIKEKRTLDCGTNEDLFFKTVKEIINGRI